MDNSEKIAKFLLRVGLAFVFSYAAIKMYFSPNNFLNYIPQFVSSILTLSQFLLILGVYELILTVWLLSGWKVYIAAIIAAVFLASVTILNIDMFYVLFRNVSICLSALALAILEWPPKVKDRIY